MSEYDHGMIRRVRVTDGVRDSSGSNRPGASRRVASWGVRHPRRPSSDAHLTTVYR